MPGPKASEPLLDQIDPEKRNFIGKLIRTGTFVAPLVASFSMANVMSAHALQIGSSNQ